MDNEIDVLNSFLNNNNQVDLRRPYRVMDVANYIVNKFTEQGHPITNLLLLKMLYYLQAYFLTNDSEQLFVGQIQKWGYGPVEPIVYSYFKDNGAAPITHSVQYAINDNGTLRIINPAGRNLQENDKLIINSVVDKLYNKYHTNPFELVEITHAEPMWLKDKDRIKNGVHNIEYDNHEIAEYFSDGEKWPWL